MRVAILDDYQSVALDMADWSGVTNRAEVFSLTDHIDDEALLAERLDGVNAIVLMRERTPITRGLLDRLPSLELLVTTGPFNASIDLRAAEEAGVTVCGTGGYIEQTVELTWALILALVRHVPDEVAAVRRGAWQHTVGHDLHGKILGIVGLGRIGSRVARVGHAFGMSVHAWSEHLTAERAEAGGATLVSKQDLFAASDVISIHLVQSPATVGTVGDPELRSMKPSAVIVNTSRGPLIDEDALVAALREERIAGAALDVFGQEPLPAAHPFRVLPNVLATPHIGYVTRETYQMFYREVVEDLVAFLEGSPIRLVRSTNP
jgi:phosphoglycerate dehydrogenase-like enzyme